MNFIKKIYIFLIAIGFVAVITFISISPFFFFNTSNVTNIQIKLNFDEKNSYNHIRSQLDLGYRIPGTQAREECALYFINEFKEIDENFTYYTHNFTINSVACQNLLFKLNTNCSNIIILAAHYDSRAKATKDEFNKSAPVPGANDGASGSAVLLDLARCLYQRRMNLSCQIWFLFFDAEDQGRDYGYGIDGWDWCEGSKAFVQNINDYYNTIRENFDCMILLDMVGGTGLKFINEQYSTSSLLSELFQTGRNLGYTNAFPVYPESNSVTDDHKAFLDYGIPSADLIINFWSNPSWPYHHTTQDNLSHISNQSLLITGRTIE
ncbi:MAG: M28 family peptidase, partial [Candidatus Lokiarchaeota archaeon]